MSDREPDRIDLDTLVRAIVTAGGNWLTDDLIGQAGVVAHKLTFHGVVLTVDGQPPSPQPTTTAEWVELIDSRVGEGLRDARIDDAETLALANGRRR